jgi:dTMP kinase
LERLEIVGGGMMAKGIFLSIEGCEGVGKSTQINALKSALEDKSINVQLTREPGGTEGAEAIRQLLLSGSDDRWDAGPEALLFAAARGDHVAKRIKPALASGAWVISDRFLDSSRAYQGVSLGLGDADILELHRIGSGGFLPDRTLILDLSDEEAARRAAERDQGQSDRIGGRNADFHAQVRKAFQHFAANEPARVRLIDASGAPEDVTARLIDALSDLLPS